MAKKSIRTPAQQEYRDNLAKKLRTLRSQWEEWKKVAKDLYKTLQDNLQDFKLVINDLDERTYYVVNYNIDIILPKNYICKKKDLIQNNAKVSIKIINKGLNVIPKKSKIMLIKKENIYFENVIINETITKDKDYSCYLNLKLINNNNNITGKQKIVFGLFQSNNMLIKQFEFIFSIS